MFNNLLTGSYLLRPEWSLGQPLETTAEYPIDSSAKSPVKNSFPKVLTISFICGPIHVIYVHAVIEWANVEEGKQLTLQNQFYSLWDDMEMHVSRARNYAFGPTEWGHSSKAQHRGIGCSRRKVNDSGG